MVLRSLWRSRGSGSHGSDEAPSHSNPGSSASSSPTEGSSEEETTEDQETRETLLKKLKRQAQTAKARAAALRSKAIKRMGRAGLVSNLTMAVHPAEKFREDLNMDSSINKPGSSHPSVRLRRLRLLVSYLKGWCANLVSCFDSWDGMVEHTILTAITDDTAVKLAPGHEDFGKNFISKSRAASVMNTVQNLTVCYADSSKAESCHKCFPIVAPLTVLPKADCEGITSSFRARPFSFCGKVSKRYRLFNMQNVMKNVPIQALVIVVDSLKTNVAMMKQFRVATHLHHTRMKEQNGVAGSEVIYPLLQSFCTLHQLALARQPLICHFTGLWSSVVLLAHLFENHGFRCQFRVAMIHTICESFVFYPAAVMPEHAREWSATRARIYRFNSRTLKMKRLRLHEELAAFDNSDPASTAFAHYCTGHCCRGETHEEKKLFALSQMTKLYTLLFSHGYEVPLTYRWVHCEMAIDYLQVPCQQCSRLAVPEPLRRDMACTTSWDEPCNGCRNLRPVTTLRTRGYTRSLAP